MSRIGKLPIPLEDVKVTVKGSKVSITGSRGKDSYMLPGGITAKVVDDNLVIHRKDDSIEQKRLHGTTRAHLSNRVTGVSKGHSISMIVQGKGYQAEVVSSSLDLQIGFSHRVVVSIPEGLSLGIVQGQNTFTVTITGNDKHLVGDFASLLYRIKPVEPYNLIGFRYSKQYVKRKTAKTVIS